MATQNTPPLSATYLNVQEARASAALPALGAWDATPTIMPCAYFDDVTLYLTYTRGAAGGAFDLQIQTSAYSVAANVPTDAEEWVTESVYAGGLLAAGADTQSRLQREFETYQATAADAEAFAYGPIALNGTIERIRIAARESGDTDTPGTLQIEAVFA